MRPLPRESYANTVAFTAWVEAVEDATEIMSPASCDDCERYAKWTHERSTHGRRKLSNVLAGHSITETDIEELVQKRTKKTGRKNKDSSP